MNKDSRNIFSDIGFDAEEAQNLKLRAQLMLKIEHYIQKHHLTQMAAAKAFGVDQPRMNKLLKGRIDLFTVDKLISLLARVNIKVSLRIAA
jgi:predicted XRE-type DNA-binding protein